jgi:hypothetical protein
LGHTIVIEFAFEAGDTFKDRSNAGGVPKILPIHSGIIAAERMDHDQVRGRCDFLGM